MASVKAKIYSSVIFLMGSIPFKRFFFPIIKLSPLLKSKLYKDLKFQGIFKVKMGKNDYFKMVHYGGTIENETYWNGLFTTWESETGWLWIEFSKISNVILDIGANTGIYSLSAKTLNKNAEVLAFEPSINTFKKLETNNSINNFDIKCYQSAISNESGKQRFFDTPDPNQTSASLNDQKLKNWEGYTGKIIEYEVETLSLEDFISKNQLFEIDLIKIDVEMHEPEIIQGLGKYLTDFKPVIFIEVLTQEIADKLNHLFSDNDFQLFHLTGNKTLSPTKIFFAENEFWNFLVIHKEKISNYPFLQFD
jgi:FkbM family methyltransferase